MHTHVYTSTCEHQQIGVAALAAQCNLPVPVTEAAIKDRLGSLLRAKLRAGEREFCECTAV